MQILNQGAEEERAETARLVSTENIFSVGNLARFFSFAVMASLTSFLRGYSMSFFEDFRPKRRRYCAFLLTSLACKFNLSHPTFTLFNRPISIY